MNTIRSILLSFVLGAAMAPAAAAENVFTPLAPCRLVDTRGFGAPIQGGAFAPNERRAYAPNGQCNLPTSRVSAILVTFTTQNLTPGSGGYLALLPPGAPVTASADIFNPGTQWSASSTVVTTGSGAQFDVMVAVATADVVIDVLGYFAPSQAVVTPATPGGTVAGINNTASGQGALAQNQGTDNTALGSGALAVNLFGSENTATGSLALNRNTTGINNTANGAFALFANTTGPNNTAVGDEALADNTSGATNTAIGANALASNTNGNNNSAIGGGALLANTTGDRNAAIGTLALVENTTGNLNTALGAGALFANTSGNRNLAVGADAGALLTTGNFNVAIANPGVAGESGTIRIGSANQTRAFIAGIRGAATGVADGVPVFVDSQGQLGTLSSSRRFKDDVVDMSDASSALMKLRPVTFHYKSDTAFAGRTLQYGLIAEEVAALYPGLVTHTADGRAETVMYQYLPPMLLNEVQKQQRVLQDQARQLAAQAAEIAALKEQAAQVALAMRRRAPAEISYGD